MRSVDYPPAARQELIDAAVWYERKKSGLGERFLDEVAKRLERSCGQVAPGFSSDFGTHTLLVRRFSYKLIVQIDATRVWVLSVSHQRRKDSHWQGRVTD